MHRSRTVIRLTGLVWRKERVRCGERASHRLEIIIHDANDRVLDGCFRGRFNWSRLGFIVVVVLLSPAEKYMVIRPIDNS